MPEPYANVEQRIDDDHDGYPLSHDFRSTPLLLDSTPSGNANDQRDKDINDALRIHDPEPGSPTIRDVAQRVGGSVVGHCFKVAREGVWDCVDH